MQLRRAGLARVFEVGRESVEHLLALHDEVLEPRQRTRAERLHDALHRRLEREPLRVGWPQYSWAPHDAAVGEEVGEAELRHGSGREGAAERSHSRGADLVLPDLQVCRNAVQEVRHKVALAQCCTTQHNAPPTLQCSAVTLTTLGHKLHVAKVHLAL